MICHVLGTVQDGGFPHLGCRKECCKKAWKNNDFKKYPSSISIIDEDSKKYWIFDVSPDIKYQLQMLDKYDCQLAGVFVTHAHYGHYSGLLEFGLEVGNQKKIPVYVMPQMYDFLYNNFPFKFLHKNQHIELIQINNKISLLDNKLIIDSFLVPHRNEFSETVGFKIRSQEKSIIYLPDIDNFDNSYFNIVDLIKKNDVIFLDGTFYNKKELNNRDISKIPHPFIEDTMKLLKNLSDNDKKKINFIHFNHTNPVLQNGSIEQKNILKSKYSISNENNVLYL
tara:strand:- start:234 stop:1076 length:843 start_codon:yes stop_codon:yes gene_type:complete